MQEDTTALVSLISAKVWHVRSRRHSRRRIYIPIMKKQLNKNRKNQKNKTRKTKKQTRGWNNVLKGKSCSFVGENMRQRFFFSALKCSNIAHVAPRFPTAPLRYSLKTSHGAEIVLCTHALMFLSQQNEYTEHRHQHRAERLYPNHPVKKKKTVKPAVCGHASSYTSPPPTYTSFLYCF